MVAGTGIVEVLCIVVQSSANHNKRGEKSMVITYKTTAEINAGILVDPEKRVYRIPTMASDDTISMGYDNVSEFIEQFSAWLTERGYDLPPVPEVGTVAHYLHHEVLGRMMYEHWEATGEQFREWLIPELIGYEDKTLEVVNCWGETQRFKLGLTGVWAAHHVQVIPGDESFHPVIEYPFQ